MTRKTTRFALIAALATCLGPAVAAAGNIDLALNLNYTNPLDSSEGGVWQVVAASDQLGIRNVSFALNNIDPTITREAPFGVVNGSDGAGFSFFQPLQVGPTTSFFVGHGAPPLSGEVGEFYGFGTISNGAPNGPGAEPVGTALAGSPEISSLTGVTNVPWAVPGTDFLGDPAFDTFATIASGTFSGTAAPEFFVNAINTQGTVFTTFGTATTPGGFSAAADTVVTTQVRSNLTPVVDFNGDNAANGADYTFFRDTLGQMVTPGTGADADESGEIDFPDLQALLGQFGRSEPLPASVVGAGLGLGTVAVPEPAGLALASFVLLSVAGLRRRGS